jgi:hypothetical protein
VFVAQDLYQLGGSVKPDLQLQRFLDQLHSFGRSVELGERLLDQPTNAEFVGDRVMVQPELEDRGVRVSE